MSDSHEQASPQVDSPREEILNSGEAAWQAVVDKQGSLNQEDRSNLLNAIDYVAARIRGMEASFGGGLASREGISNQTGFDTTALSNLRQSLAELEGKLASLGKETSPE
jgi:hypothetical protein